MNNRVKNIVTSILSEMDNDSTNYGLYNFEPSVNPTAGQLGNLVHSSYDAYIMIYPSVFYVHGSESKHLPINSTTLGFIDKIRKSK